MINHTLEVGWTGSMTTFALIFLVLMLVPSIVRVLARQCARGWAEGTQDGLCDGYAQDGAAWDQGYDAAMAISEPHLAEREMTAYQRGYEDAYRELEVVWPENDPITAEPELPGVFNQLA